MLMKYRLIKMEICGSKNIARPMTINFLGDTIDKKKPFVISNSNVKAIFGPNGSGKTAIMSAMDLYKELISSYAIFLNEKFEQKANKLINKSTNKLCMTVYYAITADDDKLITVVSHRIVIAKKDERSRISEETICEHTGVSVNAECNVLLKIVNGKLVECISEPENMLTDIIINRLLPVSDISSVAAFWDNKNIFEDVMKCVLEEYAQQRMMDYSKAFNAIFSIVLSGRRVLVYLDDVDKHNTIMNERTVSEMQLAVGGNPSDEYTLDLSADLIIDSDYDKYQAEVKRLESFIKIFKPELMEIKASGKTDHSAIHISREYIYENYSVDEEFESAGIKKLVKLFSFLDAASKGYIVFIDEMDTNINDIYLRRLAEYFVKYGEGQLIFTTHNLSPMEVLASVKRGIDFINGNNDDIPWVRNGNYSPIKQYSKGYIPGIPYNSESFDFLKCFVRGE